MTDVAEDYGYHDGSGVHRVLQRLEESKQVSRVDPTPFTVKCQESTSMPSMPTFTVKCQETTPSPGNPPQGNGLIDRLDIIAALVAGKYLTGPYDAIIKGGARNDGQSSIVYDPKTGELAVDSPAGVELTSINIDSAAGILTGDAAANLGGSFDNDVDNNIFKATFGSSFGSLSFGNVAQAGLSEQFVLDDLTVAGSLAGGGDLGAVDLIYVPDPSTRAMLVFGTLLGLRCFRRMG